MSKNAIQQARQKFPRVEQEFIAFGGGLDTETPPLFLTSGMARDAQNYECDVLGGYRTTMGYERFDGRPSPSNAAYSILGLTISGSFAVGNTVTGNTSGATGVVIAVDTTPGASYLALTKITGTFVVAEDIKVGGVTQGVSTTIAVGDGASTPLLHAQYKNLAADVYRADIAAIPGSGDVRGVVRFGGVTYGFRDNAGATAGAIYKSSGTGWTAVPLGEVVSFTVGATGVDEGDTLTQGGVTATIKRIVRISGSFGASTAAGRLIIFGRAGGNFAAGAATTTGGGTLTLSGAQTAVAIAPGGSYEFIVENFGGSTGSKRIYGIDGANAGFEFDGTDYSYTPILTGMTNDIPTHLSSHMNHLFYSFPNGSVQHSGPGTPYIWTPVLGASELGVGEDVTGFVSQPGSSTGGSLTIFTIQRIFVLYGTGVSNWVLVSYRKQIGAFTGSMQDVGFPVFLDGRGLTDLQTVNAFGNFVSSTLSARIRTWLNAQRTKVTCSCVSRDRSQYRLFFSDQYALYVTIAGRKIVGMMKILFANTVKKVWSSQESDGSETIFFGSASGMVYQMEKGTSFDGTDIESFLYLAFDFVKSPRTLKHFRRAMLEVSGLGYAGFNASYQLSYGDTNLSQPVDVAKTLSFTSRMWDAPGLTWDTFTWDGSSLSKTTLDMGGEAENVSLMFNRKSDYDSPLRFSGALVQFSQRRSLRT